jgi:phosphatidylglycerophosphate synthase
MLKSKFGRIFKPVSILVGSFFSKFGISPNAWTLLSLAFAIPGFIALYLHNLPAGLLLFFISGVIDLIDGAVARATGNETPVGAFLDGVVDRYVEFMLYLGLWYYLQDLPGFLVSNTLWIMLLLFGALMPSFVRAYAHHRAVITDKARLEGMGGLLERSERLDLLYLGMLLGCYNPAYLTYSVALVAALSHLTALQRIRYVLRQ